MLLRKLTLQDEAAFFTALAARNDPAFSLASSFKDGMNFSDYLETLAALENGKNLSANRVPSTVLFAFWANSLVGRLSIRHRLTDYLLRVEGHIGYGVLPEFRRRGFATSMLRQALPIAKKLQLSRVLLTCDDTNVGSIRTIESCNGVLENTIQHGEIKKRRYWINLTL